MFDKPWEKRSLEITEKVVSALKEQGISKQELASRLGVTPQYVSKIVHGGENLTLETISRLETALGISLGGASKAFSRVESARADAAFHKFLPGETDPAVSVRKALLFENNIPAEVSEARIIYSSETSAAPASGTVTILSKAQYQCFGKICVDTELAFAFRVDSLESSVRKSGEGVLEVEDGLLEELLPRALDMTRGFISALVRGTGLLALPLPSFSAGYLKSKNSFKTI